MGERLAALTPATLLGWVAASWLGYSAICSSIGFLTERALPGRSIWRIPLKPGQLRFELAGNVRFLAVQIVAFTLVLHLGWLRFGPGSAPLTFAVAYLGFQVYYYLLHRALHLPGLVRFHRRHHWSQVTTPLSGQSMGVVEALGWAVGYLGIPMAQSALTPVSFGGLLAYLAFNVYGNIVAHANVEVMPRSGRLGALLAPPFLVHALHHARWTGHHGFASIWMDRLLGTEWPDWPALHARVVRGDPLESLKVRGEDGPPEEPTLPTAGATAG